MAVDVSKYPSIIARPYHLALKDTPQRKDYQRFLLENTVSFLAVVAVSNVISIYEEMSNDEKNKYTEQVCKIKATLKINLSRMSLGLWNHILRDTTQVLSEFKNDILTPEICDFYHGDNSKKVVGTIDKLISIRNHDAHGNPIPMDKVQTELDRRQVMLDLVVEAANFVANYPIIVMNNFEILEGKQEYIGKQFIDDGFLSESITTTSTIPVGEAILYSTKKSTYIRLSPLLLHCKIDGSDTKHLGIFSKFVDREETTAQYLSLDGLSSVDVHPYSDEEEVDLVNKFHVLEEIYSDPDKEEVYTPNIDAMLKFSNNVVEIDESSNLTLSMSNKKSVDLQDLSCTVEFPASFSNITWDEQKFGDVLSFLEGTNLVAINFTEFSDNHVEKIAFSFMSTDAGSFTARVGLISYKYFRKDSDRDQNILTEEEVEIPNVMVEVNDLNSLDKMCPVVNVHKRIYKDNPEGDGNSKIEIGENFIFELELANIGLGAARKLSIEIVFPEKLELVDGVEMIKANINPGEKRTFRYTLKTKKPDIYNVVVRDILYYDSSERKYLTQVNDDFRVVVRSNLLKEFKYLVEESFDDLYISDDEKAKLEKHFTRSDHISSKYFQEAEYSAIINNVRKLVKQICARRNFTSRESIYEETKRQAKYTDSSQRKGIVFSIKSIPFFAIEVTSKDDISFWALSTPVIRQHGEINSNEVKYINKGIHSGALNVNAGNFKLQDKLNFNLIKYNEKFGRKTFSKWINMTLTKLEQEFFTWKKVVDIVAAKFKNSEQIPFRYDEQPLTHPKSVCREMLLHKKHNYTVGILKDHSFKNKYYVCFQLDDKYIHSIKSYFETINDKIIVFIGHTGNDENLRVGQYNHIKIKPTSTVAFNITIVNEDSYDELNLKIETVLLHIRTAVAHALFSSETFYQQNGIDILVENIPRMVSEGISFRLSEDEKAIEIFSHQHHIPGEANTFDCLGFLEKHHSGWRLYTNFYAEPSLPSEVIEQFSIGNRWYNQVTTGRWLYIDCKEADNSKAIVDIIIETHKGYGSNKLSIWPEFLINEMLVEYGKKENGFFHIVKALLGGTEKLTEITEIFLENGAEKDLKRILRRLSNYPKKYRRESPFLEKISDGEQKLFLNSKFENYLRDLLEKNLNFIS